MMIACSLPFYAQLSASSPTKPAQANTPTTPRPGLQKRAATEEAGDSAIACTNCYCTVRIIGKIISFCVYELIRERKLTIFLENG